MILGVICVATLIAVFALGWYLGRRHRERPNEVALLAAQMSTLKGPDIYTVLPPPLAKHNIIGTKPPSVFDVAKEGVIALHDSWRRKWHGQP